MKLGLHTYSYHCAAGLWDYTPRQNPPMTIEHYLQKAAECNLDGLFLADARHLDSLDYGYVAALREKAAALGLYLELGASGTNPDYLQNMVRTAHVLGSPVVRTVIDRPRPTTASAIGEWLAVSARELRETLPTCERYAVTLAMENGPQITTRELLNLLEMIDSRWVGVCFDSANPLAVMEDPVEVAGALAPLARTVHLKDCGLSARPDGFSLVGCALGEGVVDLASVLELISTHAPRINLNIETFVGKQPLAVLEDQYLAQFPETPARALGRTLRLVRDRGLSHTPTVPTERGASEDELLAEEDELVLRSVRWALQALGRQPLDAAQGGPSAEPMEQPADPGRTAFPDLREQ